MKNFEKDFESWLIEQDYIIKQFYEPKLVHEGFGFEFRNLPESMQYGVYEDFFNSVGIYPNILPIINDAKERVYQVYNDEEHYITTESLLDARRKSLIKAIEIYENRD